MTKLFNKKYKEINRQILPIEKKVVILHPLNIEETSPVFYPFRLVIQNVIEKTYTI